MRILGLDYGSKTVGVAVSDPLGFTAQGVEIIRRKSENKMRQTLARIEELIAQYQVEEIVLGLPKNMNNTLGDRAEKSLELNVRAGYKGKCSRNNPKNIFHLKIVIRYKRNHQYRNKSAPSHHRTQQRKQFWSRLPIYPALRSSNQLRPCCPMPTAPQSSPFRFHR